MEIRDIKIYMDGGTIEVLTNEGNYWIDNRLLSKTKGRVYVNSYPKDDNSNMLNNVIESLQIEIELVEALRYFKHPHYQAAIDSFVKDRSSEIRELVVDRIIGKPETYAAEFVRKYTPFIYRKRNEVFTRDYNLMRLKVEISEDTNLITFADFG